jgi:rubrerythrin
MGGAATVGMATLAIATLGVVSPVIVPAVSAASARTHHVAIARLFSGNAQVELREHFAGEAVLAGLVGTNAANLRDAIKGETSEHTTLYRGFARQATKDKCAAAATLFTEIAADEGDHAAAKVSPVVITASKPACPGTRTQNNLLTAMHGEAFANAKYTAFAAQAARS